MQIECKSLKYHYPGTNIDVFTDLNFDLAGPGFHALFGPSGVGKTTLAKMIYGKINGYNGHITASGMNRILYTYNLERLPGWSSVREHLELNTPQPNRAIVEELIDTFGIQTCMDSRFSQLSLGQQNRTNLTRYLLQDFDLLIMDESLANVDEITKETIIQKIKSLFPGRCFLYISHNVVEVSKFCKDILVLRSHRKSPQTMKIKGLDYMADHSLSNRDLEQTTLEVVNAT